jgi:hypothetical protein
MLPKIVAIITSELEERVRRYVHRRGDLSKIVTKALEDWVHYAEELETRTKEAKKE